MERVILESRAQSLELGDRYRALQFAGVGRFGVGAGAGTRVARVCKGCQGYLLFRVLIRERIEMDSSQHSLATLRLGGGGGGERKKETSSEP